MKEKLQGILKAIFWKEFTPKQEKDITKIILSSADPACDIVDYLGIERRHNRAAIRAILITESKNKE